MVRSLSARRHDHTAPAFAALAMARPAEFEGRMLAILNPTIDRNPLHSMGTVMTAAFVALLALPLAAIHPFGAPAVRAEIPAPAPVGLAAPELQPSPVNVAGSLAEPVASAAQGRTCDAADVRMDGSTILHSTHTEASSLSYRYFTTGRCIQATIVGHLEFSDDERAIVRVGERAHGFFRERLTRSDRSVEVRRGSDGRPVYTARQNGREVAFDAGMQGWLGRFLPELLREAGINVPARVARLRTSGGTAAVLAEIERIDNSGAKRAHYQELIRTPSLPSRELGTALRQAGREVTSSGDLRGILQNVPAQSRGGSEVRAGLAEAIRGIKSSGDKAAVLANYGDTDDPEMLLMVLTEVRGITSDGDKARVLARLAPRAVGHRTKAVCDAFFEAAETIESDGDLARTLSVAMNAGRSSEDVSHAVIRATARISSARDASRVLQEVAGKGLVNTARLRSAYVTAARNINSDGDFRRTMDALLSREGNR